MRNHLRGPVQVSSAAGELASESDHAAPAPLSRAVGFTRYVILLVIASVLFAAISICLVAPLLTLGNLWNVAQEGVTGSLAGHEGILRVLDLVIVMLEVVAFYLVGVGLYHLFIAPLPLAQRIGLDSLDKLETKVVSVIVVMMAVIFLEHLVLGHNAVDSLLFGAAIALVVSALASFQRQVD
jgi:uncharacterized membrane protein YqhA